MSTDAHAAPRAYPWRMRSGWWTRKGHYFWYVVREFTSLPLAIWLLWLLFQIWDARNYHLLSLRTNTAFVVFSVVCLPFALYHSFTFLSLAGSIIHFKVLDRPVSARLIVLSQFALWAGASIVIAVLLLWLSR